MEIDEAMVEQNDNVEADDALPEDVVEEQDESEESLDSLNGDEGKPAEEKQETEPQGTSEPGWIKQRVNKAVQKAVAETEARMTAMFEQQMAPIRAKMMEDEAQELVRSRKVSDIETARELVRLRQGQPASAPAEAPKAEQPRQANGQFAPKPDPAIQARIKMLEHQAENIKDRTGLDVRAEYTSNEEVRRKIISGEMDFYDVAEQMKNPRKKPPAPTRSPNGANAMNPNAIDSMSDDQFERMEKRIKEGARYSLR